MIENTVLKSTRNRGEMLLKIDYYSTYENTHRLPECNSNETRQLFNGIC